MQKKSILTQPAIRRIFPNPVIRVDVFYSANTSLFGFSWLCSGPFSLASLAILSFFNDIVI